MTGFHKGFMWKQKLIVTIFDPNWLMLRIQLYCILFASKDFISSAACILLPSFCIENKYRKILRKLLISTFIYKCPNVDVGHTSEGRHYNYEKVCVSPRRVSRQEVEIIDRCSCSSLSFVP